MKNADRIGIISGPRHANAPEALLKAVAEKRVSSSAMSLYVLLDWHRDRQTKRARPGLRGLAVWLGHSIPSIRKWRDELQAEGLLIIERPANPSAPDNYHLRWAPCPKPTTSCVNNLHTCPCESSCATFEVMGRAACATAGYTVPIEDKEIHLDPKEEKKESAKIAPPATLLFQETALRIIADHDTLYPTAKLLKAAKAQVFAGAKRVCAELVPEWGLAHILGMWETFKLNQLKAGRTVSPLWFFSAKTIQEMHHEQIKREENRRPAPRSGPVKGGITYD